MADNFKYTKNMIEWRRNTVMQKLAQGMTQSQIAQELKLHPSTISLDVQYLREKSQDALKTHISETVPMEYALTMSGLRRVLWMANQLLDKENLDIKSKISIFQLLATVHKDMFALTADGVTVERALSKIKAIESKLLESKSEEEPEPELEPEPEAEEQEQEENNDSNNE